MTGKYSCAFYPAAHFLKYCVHKSGELVHVKVVGPSLPMKHLEIGHFHNKSSLLSMGEEVRLASLQKKVKILVSSSAIFLL